MLGKSALAIGVLALAMAFDATSAWANPSGPIVVSGDNHKGEVETHIEVDGSTPRTSAARYHERGSSSACTWTPDAVDNSVLLDTAEPGSQAARDAAAGG